MISSIILGHEGHKHFSLADLSHFLGILHPILLHFPIALIVMAVVSEILWRYTRNPLFDDAARFMIIAAALFAIPTVLTGLAFSYGAEYEGANVSFFEWHRLLGFFTMSLAIVTAFIRQYKPTVYICSLILLLVSVTLTGYFGGSLTFGLV